MQTIKRSENRFRKTETGLFNLLFLAFIIMLFANRLMYPIYTTLIAPIDPEDPNVWIETAGDLVHYILPVFKNYSNNQVFFTR